MFQYPAETQGKQPMRNIHVIVFFIYKAKDVIFKKVRTPIYTLKFAQNNTQMHPRFNKEKHCEQFEVSPLRNLKQEKTPIALKYQSCFGIF
jgi:hypothetical protein